MTRRPYGRRRNSDPAIAAHIVSLAGLSPRQLSARTGYSHVHLWRVLTGRSPVTEGVAVAIASAMGLPTSILFAERQERDDAA